MLKELLKEPLLHFLLGGLALFLAFGYVRQDSPSEEANRIVVEEERLRSFLQQGPRSLARDRLLAGLDGLSAEELARLVEEFVREEALYREAKALGLDVNDYGARQRLIRQLELINREVVSSRVEISESDLEAYLAAHGSRYFVPPRITFTHVFWSADKHGDEGARRRALSTLEELNEARIPFHRALSYGDRFLYHRNYVSKDRDEVASHFGSDMQQELFAAEPNEETWLGPFRSLYGYHVVMVTKKTAGYMPPLDELRGRVEADAYVAQVEADLERITRAIVDGYDVELDAPLRARLELPERPR